MPLSAVSRFAASRDLTVPKHPNFCLEQRDEAHGGLVMIENKGCTHGTLAASPASSIDGNIEQPPSSSHHQHHPHHHHPHPSSSHSHLMDVSQTQLHSHIVPLNVIDSMTCSTNGFLGVHHRSETQTSVLRSQVIVNGVFHKVPQRQDVPSVSIPMTDEVGAPLCVVDINAFMDGRPCKLLDQEARSVSFEDCAYRSVSHLTSPCGSLTFDMHYTRLASLLELPRWLASVRYTNFHFGDDHYDRASLSQRGEQRATPRPRSQQRVPTARFTEPHSFDHDSAEYDSGTPTTNPTSFLMGRPAEQTPTSGDSDGGALYSARRNHSSLAPSPLPPLPGGVSTPRIPPHREFQLELAVEISFATDVWRIAPGASVSSITVESKSSGIQVQTLSSATCHIVPSEQSRGSGKGVHVDPYADSTAAGAAKRPCSTMRPQSGVQYAFSSSETDPTASPATLHSNGEDGTSMSFAYRFRCPIDAECPPHEVVLACGMTHSALSKGESATTTDASAPQPNTPAPSSNASLASPPLLRRHTDQGFDTANLLPWNEVPEKVEAALNMPCQLAAQRALTSAFWSTYSVEVVEQDEVHPGRLSLGLRYGAFRTFCVGRAAQHGIPRRGLSAPGFSMQYSFQSYLYVGLMLVYTDPDCARRLLRHVYEMLPQAILNARRMLLPCGALYPHTTITGQECGPHVLNRSSRFHLNADLSLLIFSYLEAVRNVPLSDRLWLLEILIQTARVWPMIGSWDENEDCFRIDGVCGPDEYNGIVDGNFYTALAAKRQIAQTCQCLTAMMTSSTTQQETNRLLASLDVTLAELDELQRVGEGIVLRRDDRKMVYFAHDAFDSLKTYPPPPQDPLDAVSDVQNLLYPQQARSPTPAGKSVDSWESNLTGRCPSEQLQYPLSHNYHPLFIYRSKLCEIPDVLLGMLLHPAEFERGDLRRNYLYYAPFCTHDTPESLGVTAAVGLRAFGDFHTDTSTLLAPLILYDLDNVAHSAEDGFHLSAMAASWLCVVYGLGGMRVHDGTMTMDPVLPPGMERVSFTLQWRGSVMQTTITATEIQYQLVKGEQMRFIHDNSLRIHLHRGYNGVEPNTRMTLPRAVMQQVCTYFDGVIFTMDALVANLLDLNFFAWKKVLDPFLESRYREQCYEAQDSGGPMPVLQEFTLDEFIERMVYQEEVREAAYSGLHEVLLARGINIPLGSSDDSEITQTRFGLANQKVEELKELLRTEELELVPEAVSLIHDLQKLGVRVGLVSYTRSMYDMLQRFPELQNAFLTTIDGTEAREKHMRGRPHMDLFEKAAQKMHLPASRCVVVATHLDQGYTSLALRNFFMFLNVEEKRSTEYRHRRGSLTSSHGDAESNNASSRLPEEMSLPSSRSEGSSVPHSLLYQRGGRIAAPTAVSVEPRKFPRTTAELEDLALSQFQRM